jgi:hypothetical protein
MPTADVISGIIQRLLNDNEQNYRPILNNEINGIDPKLRFLLEVCWHKDPELRPDFHHIYKRLRAINKRG